MINRYLLGPKIIILGILIGAIVTYISIKKQWNSKFILNLSIGFILAILAIDLIPQISSNKSGLKNFNTEKLLILFGLIVGSFLVLFFLGSHLSFNKDIISLMILSFVIGIIFSLTTPANIILSLAFGSFLVFTLMSTKVNPIGLIILSFILIMAGYIIGSTYTNKKFFYFILAITISILIGLLINRLLITNSFLPSSELKSATFAIFLGFILGWLIQ